ncbi:uncharacterized protein LOC123559651 isoform X2 [Mercenaria mercenaria]|uniref:uncharacterized protein LOC123559651 isoform X2 n=1 Tax=Mercenaria mercenaria TaxID=6596 RepID=UPI00234E99C0|nr:uncharacterized protein LOC123559651 isoform X2 [Mercenaria mercenaria]
MATFNKYLCLLIVIFKITGSLGSYYISQSSVAPDENRQCQMAVPKIISGLKNGRARLDIKEDIGLMDMDETLWIGYFKSEMTFEYIGCVKESNISGYQNLSTESINGSLSKCYKNCQDSEVIGVTMEKCYCFDSSPHSRNKSLLSSSCNAVCKNPDSAFCGGPYVSLCRTNTNGENGQRLGRGRKQRLDAAQSCFTKKSYPISYSNASKIRHGGPPAYTDDLRLDIIYTQDEDTTDDVCYGFLRKQQNGKYFLRFTDDNSKKRVLCENDTTDTTKSRDDQQIQTTQPSPDTNTGTAAIVSIIVVLVIIAIVIAVVLVHRRCKSSLRLDNRPKTETVAEYEYNYPEFTNKSTNAEANTPGDVLYNYPDFTLQDKSNTGEIRIGLNTYDDSNIDGTYNKTNTGKKGYSSTYANEDCECNDEQAERVYNQLENDDYNVLGTRQKMVPDKTYDQAIQVQKSGTSASDDITYDSSMSSGVKLKKNVGGVTDNVYNTGNEIYNRIGEETEKRGGKSDNLYGTKQMEKCKYMKPASDTDSQTYNSTSEISETCGLTDNPYSKLDTEHKDK